MTVVIADSSPVNYLTLIGSVEVLWADGRQTFPTGSGAGRDRQ